MMVLEIIWICVVIMYFALRIYDHVPKLVFNRRTDKLVKQLERRYNITNPIVMPRFSDGEITDAKTGKQMYRFVECGKDGRKRTYYVSKNGKMFKQMSWQ